MTSAGGEAAKPFTINVLGVRPFEGATPWSIRPSLLCSLDDNRASLPDGTIDRLGKRFPALTFEAEQETASEALAKLAAQLAPYLLTPLMYVEHSGGVWTREKAAAFWVDHLDLAVTKQAVRTALFAIGEAARGSSEFAAFESQLRALEQLCLQRRPNQESALLIEAARRADIPYLPGLNRWIWQFGWGVRGRTFQENSSDFDGYPAGVLTRNKATSKAMFQRLGLPTPVSVQLGPGGDVQAAAEKVGWPCVVKPLDRGRGVGVAAGIRTVADLESATAEARKHSNAILVEAHVEGEDHRLTIAGGQLVAVTQRLPPMVTGDGRTSLRGLLDALNTRRRDPEGEGRRLKPVPEDQELHSALAAEALSLNDVPEAGRAVRLRRNSNHSTGGSLVDLTAVTHPQVKAMAEQLAAAFCMKTAGIDYMTPDISRSCEEAGGAFIEINATPGIKGLGAAGHDELELAGRILTDFPARIPATLLLVPNGCEQEALEQLIERAAAPGVGIVGVAGAWADGLNVPALPPAAADRVRMLFRYRTVEAIYVVWPISVLYDTGLPLDRLTRAVVVNASLEPSWREMLQLMSEELIDASDLDAGLRLAADTEMPASAPRVS